MSLADDVPEVLGLATVTSYDVLQAQVPRGAWAETVTRARDELGLTFFDVICDLSEGKLSQGNQITPLKKVL